MGTIISNNGMKPDPDKVAAVTKMPTPQNKSVLLRFMAWLPLFVAFLPQPKLRDATPVSYTHLTLPTKRIV